MSQMAYGSSTAYGPGCGRCFKVTLLNTYTGTPPFFPDVTKSLVIKVTDLCPNGGAGWCSATEDKPNPYAPQFVLSWKSVAHTLPAEELTLISTLLGRHPLYRTISFRVMNHSMVSTPGTSFSLHKC